MSVEQACSTMVVHAVDSGIVEVQILAGLWRFDPALSRKQASYNGLLLLPSK